MKDIRVSDSIMPLGEFKAQAARVQAEDLMEAGGAELGDVRHGVVAAVEAELKYRGYLARDRERAEKLRGQANFLLDNDLPYKTFATLAYEAREKLARIRPENLAQAGRIPGVSPADLQNLMLEVRRLRGGAAPQREG